MRTGPSKKKQKLFWCATVYADSVSVVLNKIIC